MCLGCCSKLPEMGQLVHNRGVGGVGREVEVEGEGKGRGVDSHNSRVWEAQVKTDLHNGWNWKI